MYNVHTTEFKKNNLLLRPILSFSRIFEGP